MLIDRWFAMAAFVFVLMAFLTSCGFLHATGIALVYDSDGRHIAQAAGVTETWKIIVTYMCSAALMAVFSGLQKIKKMPPPEEENYRALQAVIAAAKAPEPVKETEVTA